MYLHISFLSLSVKNTYARDNNGRTASSEINGTILQDLLMTIGDDEEQMILARQATHGLCGLGVVILCEGRQQVFAPVVLVAVDHDLTQRVRPRHLRTTSASQR